MDSSETCSVPSWGSDQIQLVVVQWEGEVLDMAMVVRTTATISQLLRQKMSDCYCPNDKSFAVMVEDLFFTRKD
jgi:hypothetical protein